MAIVYANKNENFIARMAIQEAKEMKTMGLSKREAVKAMKVAMKQLTKTAVKEVELEYGV